MFLINFMKEESHIQCSSHNKLQSSSLFMFIIVTILSRIQCSPSKIIIQKEYLLKLNASKQNNYLKCANHYNLYILTACYKILKVESIQYNNIN